MENNNFKIGKMKNKNNKVLEMPFLRLGRMGAGYKGTIWKNKNDMIAFMEDKKKLYKEQLEKKEITQEQYKYLNKILPIRNTCYKDLINSKFIDSDFKKQ